MCFLANIVPHQISEFALGTIPILLGGWGGSAYTSTEPKLSKSQILAISFWQDFTTKLSGNHLRNNR
jgi:hypothetical protein